MRHIVLAAALTAVLPQFGTAQPKPKLSPEDLKKIQDYKDGLPQKGEKGELTVDFLRVGASGVPTNIDAKVMQVIDKNSMLVGLEDSRTGKGRYSVWVMVKAPTAGLVDGDSWRGATDWRRITGSPTLAVSGTTTYKTAAGGTKTVFVIEAGKPEEKPADPKQDGGEKKRGAAAYDDFIDPVRDVLVKHWEQYREELKQAIAAEEQRATNAKTPQERQQAVKSVRDYKERLAKLEVNDPPFIDPRFIALKKSFPGPGAEKWNGQKEAAAYEVFIDPVRDLLVKDWEKYRDELTKAVAENERLTKEAKTEAEKLKYATEMLGYRERLAKLETNDPPFIDPRLLVLKKKGQPPRSAEPKK